MTTPRRGSRRAFADRAWITATYEACAAGLYDYCHWTIGDPGVAEDAVYGALLAAAGEPALVGMPELLRPWLYAAARNECLRASQRPGGPPFIGSLAGTRNDSYPEASSEPRRELSLVRYAAARLSSQDQEIAELSLRHRLGAADLAAVLGSSGCAMRAAIVRVETVLSVMCGDDARRMFGTPHPMSAPEMLYARVVTSAAVPDRVAHFSKRAKPLGRSGIPLPIDVRRRTRVVGLAAAAVCVTLLTVGAILLATEPTKTAGLVAEPEPSAETSLSVGHPRSPTTSPSPSAPVTRPAAPRRALPVTNPARPGTPTPSPTSQPTYPGRPTSYPAAPPPYYWGGYPDRYPYPRYRGR
jgi:DNA-directed RNA polymerase specialized sigma24 family protein